MTQILWNKIENRPATFNELLELEQNHGFTANFWGRWTNQGHEGEIWLEITAESEKTFELREQEK